MLGIIFLHKKVALLKRERENISNNMTTCSIGQIVWPVVKFGVWCSVGESLFHTRPMNQYNYINITNLVFRVVALFLSSSTFGLPFYYHDVHYRITTRRIFRIETAANFFFNDSVLCVWLAVGCCCFFLLSNSLSLSLFCSVSVNCFRYLQRAKGIKQ